jgi:riboflavin synthase
MLYTLKEKHRNREHRGSALALFTGIVEHVGTIETLELKRDGGRVTIEALSVVGDLGKSDSIAVNGCCLTVVEADNYRFSADLSGETIRKTTFGVEGTLKKGTLVNLEGAMTPLKELGGHFVLGHVDTVGRVIYLAPEGDNWRFGVEVPQDFARYMVPEGSITIDGISLTIARWDNRARIAEVAIIPYTYGHTNLRDRKPGDGVNLEGDVLGKYVERYLEARHETSSASSITLSRLIEEGF